MFCSGGPSKSRRTLAVIFWVIVLFFNQLVLFMTVPQGPCCSVRGILVPEILFLFPPHGQHEVRHFLFVRSTGANGLRTALSLTMFSHFNYSHNFWRAYDATDCPTTLLAFLTKGSWWAQGACCGCTTWARLLEVLKIEQFTTFIWPMFWCHSCL